MSEQGLEQNSDKSKVLVAVLAFCFGVFGAHRFYAGKFKSAILQLVTIEGLGVCA